jgi:superfamily II DNA or RNA helicase
LKTIKRILDKKPDYKIIVVVPTDYLKKQWIKEVKAYDLSASVDIHIINSIIKQDFTCDFLICDEVHLFMADTFRLVFEKVEYKLIMCLTGTIDRLDGKQVLLSNYAPICDTVTLKDATEAGWVAEFKQFKVLIDVDLEEYHILNAGFLHHFSWFNFVFEDAMNCAIDWQFRDQYARLRKVDKKEVMGHAMGFLNNMKARKSFVYDHPKKIEIANQIINAREDKKIITFTKSVAHAKQICCGGLYHGKMTPKKKEAAMTEFNECESGVLNSCQALNVGADVVGVSSIIIISGDSSSITKKQRIGRSIRKEEDKVAEIWQLVLRGTVDESWYKKASVTLKTHTIDEKQLTQLLKTGSYGQSVTEKLLFNF